MKRPNGIVPPSARGVAAVQPRKGTRYASDHQRKADEKYSVDAWVKTQLPQWKEEASKPVKTRTRGVRSFKNPNLSTTTALDLARARRKSRARRQDSEPEA